MEKTTVEPFRIIGISVRCTNEESSPIGKLWGRFYSENIPARITGKAGDEIYSVYTDYESDYRGEYTTIIGCRVNCLENVPEGLTAREFPGGTYLKFTERGSVPDIIVNRWMEIWKQDGKLGRKYTADFEVYGEKAQDQNNAEVDIFVAV